MSDHYAQRARGRGRMDTQPSYNQSGPGGRDRFQGGGGGRSPTDAFVSRI